MSIPNDFQYDIDMPPPKRPYVRHNSEGSIKSDISARNLENGGFEPTAPDDTLRIHHRTMSNVTTSTHQETYYSVNSSAASASFYSVQRPPANGASSTRDQSSIVQPSVVSSRRPQSSNPSTMASLKILSPEELSGNPNFVRDGLTPTSDGSSSEDQLQRHPMGPWTPATHPNKFLSSSSVNEGNNQSLDQNSCQSSHRRDSGFISNTRLTTSDTKMIMNINTSDDRISNSAGRRVSVRSLTHSVNAINDKNIKLIRKLDEVSQSNLILPKSSNRNNTPRLSSNPYSISVIHNDTETLDYKSTSKRPSVISLVKGYANLENIHGFFGLAVNALAAIPTPAMLLHDDDTQEPKSPTTHKRRYWLLLKTYTRLALSYLFSVEGFIVTAYFVTILGVSIMLIILLCNGAPAMTRKWGPDNVQHSPRRIWIEICTQVLNGLFCLAGLGLFLIRARDVYLWIRGVYFGDIYRTKKILRIHSNWFWGGFSRPWKLFTVIFVLMASSILQVLLCFVMWNYSKYNRPTWATASLIGTSASLTVLSGLIMLIESRRILSYCYATGHIRRMGLTYDMTDLR